MGALGGRGGLGHREVSSGVAAPRYARARSRRAARLYPRRPVAPAAEPVLTRAPSPSRARRPPGTIPAMIELDLDRARHRSRRAAVQRLACRREDATESLATFWVRFDGERDAVRIRPVHDDRRLRRGRRRHRPRIVQRPYSVASDPGVAGDRWLRDVRPPRRGRAVHAAAVAAAGRAPDADDRAEGQVHARARRRPDAPVHLVRHRQRAVRLDDEADAARGPAAQGRVPQRRVVCPRPRLSRAGRGLGRPPATIR